MVFVRRYARKFSLTNSASMVAPARQDRMGDPTWTAEIMTGAEDSTLDFDQRRLTPHPLARRIKVSNTLLRLAAIGVDAIVRDEFSYEFATVEENAFLNGHGAGQPLGIFMGVAGGISTSRDVSTGNTTTAIKADNLIECAYTMPMQYRRDARWVFHRDALKMIRKLKDGEGNYLWQPGLAGDRPATILSIPYDESEYCPNTFTTGKYVGALCCWNYYWIVDALTLGIQVLRELYAETNQTGYIARSETDGMPVHENGFVRVTLA
jgi:HK97 family phage major capsid protein